MKKIQLNHSLEVLELGELDQEDKELILSAQKILKDAYAPYSHYLVGAAVKLSSGKVLVSSNQENVSFPVGICAERSLLAFAGANYPQDPPVALAVAAQRRGDEDYAQVSPCGLCRQAILESETRFAQPIEILILHPKNQVIRSKGIQSLLPLSLDDLSK
ncbi:cytidine deaminase [Algoriphagus namhaensis]